MLIRNIPITHCVNALICRGRLHFSNIKLQWAVTGPHTPVTFWSVTPIFGWVISLQNQWLIASQGPNKIGCQKKRIHWKMQPVWPQQHLSTLVATLHKIEAGSQPNVPSLPPEAELFLPGSLQFTEASGVPQLDSLRVWMSWIVISGAALQKMSVVHSGQHAS